MKQYIVDAFADRLFQGNPAAVCVLEQWPEDRVMQQIAAENNLSETAFLVKENENYRIRWFTPEYEIDLCGHATLASAFVLHHFVENKVERISFLSQSGSLEALCEGERYTLDFPSRPPCPVPMVPGLSAALGAKVRELYLSRDLVAVLEDEETVRTLNPDFDGLRKLEAGDGVIVTARGTDCDFVSRGFYPKSGVNEDPVTGSAHCNLIPYWAGRLQKRQMTARQLSARGGVLCCQNCGERVKIGGKAVLYAIAELCVD